MQNIREISPKDIVQKGVESLNLNLSDVIYALCCYAISACTVLGNLSPFPIGVYIAAFASGKWLMFAVSAIMGVIRFAQGINAVTYVFAIIGATAVMAVLKGDFIKRALVVSAVFSTILFVRNLFTGAMWYEYGISIMEGMLCFSAAFVFRSAVPLLIGVRERRCIPDSEVLCLILFFVAIIRCTVGIPEVMGLNVAVILSILLLFVFNTDTSPSNACAVGVLFGLAMYDGTVDIGTSIGTFAVCSMTSGLLSKLGKWGVVLGFMLANMVLVAFFENVMTAFDIFEIVVAAVVFALLPKRIIRYADMINSKTVRMATKAFVEQDKLQTVISKRLVNLSDSFCLLACSYEECFKNETMSKNYVVHMFDTACGKICPDCGLKYNCWERCYKDTYKAMFQMLETAEKKGGISEGDVPEYLSSKCIKLKEFVMQFERMMDIYRVEKMWQQKLNSSRRLVADQLTAIGRSVANVANEFDMCVDTATEKVLKAELDKQKADFKNVVFLKGNGDNFSVEIVMKKWNYTVKEEHMIESVVAKVTGKDTVLTSVINTGDGVSLTLRDSFRYRASIGTSFVPKDGEKVSGDSFVVCRSSGDGAVAAISDGMGTGPEAAAESRTATELLSNFLGAGIDTETALELINSSLLLRSSGDSFATMDVCRADLSSGSILISKNGAATGYVKTGDEVTKVESDSLPFGVIGHYGKISTKIFPVKGEATVVMMSDGVADVFAMHNKEYIPDIIKEKQNPQLTASTILGKAMELSDGKAMDDMTVVVVDVWET